MNAQSFRPSKDRARPAGLSTVAIYTRDETGLLHMRLTLPEEKVVEMRYFINHGREEHDGGRRMRLSFEWLTRGSVIRLSFVEERMPAGERQLGNTLSLDPSEKFYIYNVSVPGLLDGCTPGSATPVELIDWHDNHIDILLPEELMPYEHRFLDQPRRPGGTEGQVSSMAAVQDGGGQQRMVQAVSYPPAPHRFDVNLLQQMLCQEPEGVVELRQALSVVHQCCERIRAQGFAVELLLRDGVPRARYIPAVIQRFRGQGRWQVKPDPTAVTDTIETLSSGNPKA
jgi:hypothetical protein